MIFPVYQALFFIFATVLVVCSFMVVISRNPVRAILFLVMCFVASSILWMMLEAEFLSLVLIFVYVGAVMTLFLFVVMMLNIEVSQTQEKFVRFLPFGLIVFAFFLASMLIVLSPLHLSFSTAVLASPPLQYGNTEAIGILLFTHYPLASEMAAVILLIAIISAIALAFHGKKPGTKSQNLAKQHQAKKSARLRLVDIKRKK